MILILILAVLIYGGMSIRNKRRRPGASWIDAIKATWQYNILDNQAWVVWLCALFALTLLRFLFADKFSHTSYRFSGVRGARNGLYTFVAYMGSCAIIIWLIIRLFKSRGGEGRDVSYGSAEWTRDSILASAGISIPPRESREFLYTGSLYFNTRQGHLLTSAGSRSGKGSALIVPNLLLPNYDSFVVSDPKGENAFMTARYQAEQLGKKVIILDPWGEQKRLGATHGIPTASMNPLDFIKANPEEMADNCNLLADILVPFNPEAKEPYFDNCARSMIKTYLLHLLTERSEEEHNLWTIYRWLRLDGDQRLELWAEMKTSDDELVRSGVGEFTHFSESSNTLGSIVSSAHDATRFLESRHLRSTLCTSGFQPYDLPQGGMSVYVTLPERYFRTHSRFLRLVVGLCLRACNHRPDQRVNFLLDESGVIGKLDDIENGYAYAAGQNIRIWSFFQNLNQIKKLYGDEGLTNFTGCQHFQVFGVDCQFTAETVSKMLGDSTIVVKNTSHSQGKESSTTTSFNKTGRALMTAEEVGKTDEIINFFRDEKIRYKFKGPRWRYFEPSPNCHDPRYNPNTDVFERQRIRFMNVVELMPQHRKLQRKNVESKLAESTAETFD